LRPYSDVLTRRLYASPDVELSSVERETADALLLALQQGRVPKRLTIAHLEIDTATFISTNSLRMVSAQGLEKKEARQRLAALVNRV
jgi:hypothetical protein